MLKLSISVCEVPGVKENRDIGGAAGFVTSGTLGNHGHTGGEAGSFNLVAHGHPYVCSIVTVVIVFLSRVSMFLYLEL